MYALATCLNYSVITLGLNNSVITLGLNYLVITLGSGWRRYIHSSAQTESGSCGVVRHWPLKSMTETAQLSIYTSGADRGHVVVYILVRGFLWACVAGEEKGEKKTGEERCVLTARGRWNSARELSEWPPVGVLRLTWIRCCRSA